MNLSLSKYLLLIGFWWLLWLTVSQFSLTGLDTPSITATTIICSFFLILFLVAAVQNNYLKQMAIIPLKESEKNISKNIWELYFKFLSIINLPILAFVCLRFITIFPDYADSFRILFFGDEENAPIIFGSFLTAFLYQMITVPLLKLQFFLGIAIWLSTGKKIYMLLGILFFVISESISLGRTTVYFLLILTALYLFLSNDGMSKKSSKSGIFFSMFALALLIVMITISRNNLDFIVQFLASLYIDYHTIGFIFFDRYLTGEINLADGEFLYGEKILSSVSRYFYVLFDYDLSGFIEMAKEQGKFINLSSSGENTMVFNAYYTMFTTMFLDGGLIAVFLYAIFFGILTANAIFDINLNQSVHSYLVILIITEIFFLSLFQSRLEGALLTYLIALMGYSLIWFIFFRVRSKNT